MPVVFYGAWAAHLVEAAYVYYLAAKLKLATKNAWALQTFLVPHRTGGTCPRQRACRWLTLSGSTVRLPEHVADADAQAVLGRQSAVMGWYL